MNTEKIKNYRAAEARHWDHYNIRPKEHFLDLAPLNAKVRVQEIGEGEPVLFVHGGPNAGSTWASLVAELQDFRCLLLDRPGSGLSEPVDITRYDFRQFGADLLSSVLDELGLQKSAVVASSFGGALSLFFAAAHPDRVTRMVQQGCPAAIEGMGLPPFMRLLAIGPVGRFMAGQKSTMSVSLSIMRQIGHGKTIDEGNLPPGMMDWYLALMNGTDTMQNELQAIQHIASWRGVRPAFSYDGDLMGSITTPTLFLWGEDDTFGGREVAEHAAASMPDASLASFPDQGHLPWLDDPVANARYVRTFLQTGQVHEE